MTSNITDIDILLDPPSEAHRTPDGYRLVWPDGGEVSVVLRPGQEMHALLSACNVKIINGG